MESSSQGKRKAEGDPSASRWKKRNKKKKYSGNRPRAVDKTQRYKIEEGDAGIWVTCVRGTEIKAEWEIRKLFEEYVELLYGVKPKTLLDKEGTEAVAAEEIEEPEEDLEESVAKEIEAIRALNRPKGPEDDFVFAPVRVDVACLLFVKTRPPIEPVEFVRRICLDALGRGDAPGASGCSLDRKTRHVNRLTPVSWVGRATMDDLLEGARGVLGKQFVLRGTSAAQDAVVEGGKGGKDGNGEETTKEPSPAPRPCSYAIREAIRNHDGLRRTEVIERLAGLIDKRHPVNLTSPDKFILVEIFESYCGLSVVPGDWLDLKKYNLYELYNAASKESKTKENVVAEGSS